MKPSTKKTVAAGVVTLAAAAAGAYLLSDKKNRKKLSSWAGKAKREVVKELKNVSSSTQTSYNRAIEGVMKNYKNLKNLDASEVAALAQDLKNSWRTIQSQLKNKPKSTTRKSAAKSGGSRKK